MIHRLSTHHSYHSGHTVAIFEWSSKSSRKPDSSVFWNHKQISTKIIWTGYTCASLRHKNNIMNNIVRENLSVTYRLHWSHSWNQKNNDNNTSCTIPHGCAFINSTLVFLEIYTSSIHIFKAYTCTHYVESRCHTGVTHYIWLKHSKKYVSYKILFCENYMHAYCLITLDLKAVDI